MAIISPLTGTQLIGFTIVAADGNTKFFRPSGFTRDNEGYNASSNAWSFLKSDPTARTLACARSIGQRLYVASGTDSLTQQRTDAEDQLAALDSESSSIESLLQETQHNIVDLVGAWKNGGV